LVLLADELSNGAVEWCESELGAADNDWERYNWWSKSIEGGIVETVLCAGIAELLPSF
jgi:hypothetical protein